MARVPVQPAAAPKRLSPSEIRRGIERLNERISDLRSFDLACIRERANPPQIAALSTSIGRTLERIFGEDTADFRRFKSAAQLAYNAMAWSETYPAISDFRQSIASHIARSIALLEEAVKTLQDDLADSEEVNAPNLFETKSAVSRKVFVVHGHDNEAKNEVARFLSKIGLDEIILHERPNKGRHLLTKFQEESEGASFAVILLTPDDEGGLPGKKPQKRARQNVIFELGFFIGKMGLSRVAPLVKGEVERPSDYDGVGYITLDPGGGWKGLLARELRAADVPFDAAKVFEA
jgi:predicted nucleotide-binding protein